MCQGCCEEMTQLNTSFLWGSEIPFESQRGVIAVEFHQNKEISGGGKNGKGKELNFAIRPRRANKGSINIKEKEREGVV